MNRRELLKRSAAAGFIAAVPFSLATKSVAGLGASRIGGADSSGSAAATNPLKPPKSGTIAVAYPLSRGVVDIDFTGPWAIFGSVMLPGGDMTSPFHQYSVAETKAPLVTGSGLTVVPDYTFETAPQPNVIVIPAQKDSAAMLHVHGKIDAAGQTSRRRKVAFLEVPNAAYHMDLRELLGEIFVCIVVSGGRLPVEQPVFASTYAPTQTDMITSTPTDDLRIHWAKGGKIQTRTRYMPSPPKIPGANRQGNSRGTKSGVHP